MQAQQKVPFKAEVRQLLDILTHSVYATRDVFLRELLSNASDALDKLRFEQARGTEVASPDVPLGIEISVDKDARTLTIVDTGIGQSAAEMAEHLGTIAKSGSAEFLAGAGAGSEVAKDVIGRFGVGFYSAFMVAAKVEVVSRSALLGHEPARWESDGGGSFDITDAPADTPRGTRIVLHLREDAVEFLDPGRIKGVIHAHSNFLAYPISVEGERVNTVTALWRESKFAITPEQYKEFYQFLTHDEQEPLETIHVSVDAPVQFSALAFVPKTAPEHVYPGMETGLDLYVRRVLISKSAQELLPEYLRFVRGVVDTEDVPLSISREALSENIVLRKIAKALCKQILNSLLRLAERDEAAYAAFWHAHGKLFKLGYMDFLNREDFAKLLRFGSSATPEKELTSLAAYVARAKTDQKTIYYQTGPGHAALDASPHLEILRKKGLEVLYLYEPIDEFVLDGLHTFGDLTFKGAETVTAEELDAFPDLDEARSESLSDEDQAAQEALNAFIKKVLAERVVEVKSTDKLTKSPACLVGADQGVSSHMAKMLKFMAKDDTPTPKSLEVNPHHPLIANLRQLHASKEAEPVAALVVEQVFEQAQLQDGVLPDPHAMANRVSELLTQATGWWLRLHSN